MHAYFTFAAPVLFASTLASQVIWENGPFVTNPTGGPGGVAMSFVTAGLNVRGYPAGWTTGSLSDDFAVNGAMTITDIEVFGYVIGAPPTVTEISLAIYSNGPTNIPGTLVAGSPAWGTNLVGATGFTVSTTSTGVYRAVNTTPIDLTRLIYAIKVTLPSPITLSTGIYWLRLSYTTGIYSPPITVPGELITGNAQETVQNLGGSYFRLNDGPNAQGLPFKLYGSSTLPPGTVVDTGLPSCGSTTINVVGPPVVGGFLHVTLGSVTGLGVIGYGFNTTPTVFCGCVAGHEYAAVVVGSTNTLRIPMLAAFGGVLLRIQGADFGGTGGCPGPMVAFTRTMQLTL